MSGKIDWIKDDGSPITTNSRQATIDYCESLGWKRASAKPEATADLPAADPDKGSGIPGTPAWHTSAILGSEKKHELLKYLKEAEIKCNTNGNLDAVKKKAIEYLRITNDNNSADS